MITIILRILSPRTTEGVKLYPEEGVPGIINVPADNGYVEEIVDFVNCIREGKESVINPPEASLLSLKIALAEKVSADTGKTVAL